MKTGAKSTQKQARKPHDESPRFESLIAEMSTDFLKWSASEVDAGVRTWLGRLGEFFQVDRVNLWWPREDKTEYEVTHTWAASDLPDATGVVTTEMPWLVDLARSGGVISVERIDDLPDDASPDKEALKAFGTLSFVAVPMEVGDALYGGLTIATLRKEREWNPEVPIQLRLAAGILAGALLRKRAEQRLQMTQSAVDSAADEVLWVRPDGSIGYANDQACNALEYTREELLTLSVEDIDPRYGPEKYAELWTRLQTDKTALFESVHKTKSGRVYPVELRCTYVEFAGNEYVFAAARDITERKRALEALRESEARSRVIFEMAATGIALIDLQGRIVVSNPALQRIVGYSGKELQGKIITDFYHPDDVEKDWSLAQELLAGKREHYQLVKRYIHKEGRIVITNVTASLVRDENGQPQYGIGIVQDITEREHALEDLRREQEKAQTYLDISGVMMVVLERDQTVSLINKKGCEILGCSEDEIIGKNWFEMAIPEWERERVQDTFGKLMAGDIEPVQGW
jgi:PAS domain S-box-containing protein